MLPENVQHKLDALPAAPGVYLFKDRRGAVVYVGKARSRQRVELVLDDLGEHGPEL